MKLIHVTALLPLYIAFILPQSALPARADPPPDGNWVAVPELTDNFQGNTLDSSKWYDHNPTWLGRLPGYFSPKNVSVGGGALTLTARAEDLPGLPAGYHTFTTAAVQSKARALYGYFEVRCKTMNSRASSAFWFYAQDPTMDKPTCWTEIDVFEVCAHSPKFDMVYNMNVHVFVSPDLPAGKQLHQGDTWKAPFRFSDAFHIYGLEWDRDSIKWYVDGQCVKTMQNTYWHQPLTMNFDSETMPDWMGLPDKVDLPSTYTITYVKSWKK